MLKKRILLSSVVIAALAFPAFAESEATPPSNIEEASLVEAPEAVEEDIIEVEEMQQQKQKKEAWKSTISDVDDLLNDD